MTGPEPLSSRIPRAKNGLAMWLLARYRLAREHPAKLRIWRWLHRLTGQKTLTVRYAGKAWLELDVQDYVQGWIAWTGYYEPEVWEALARFATGNEVFWDIGGHVGSVAIRAALDPRIQVVHTFEPNPHTAARLLKNLSLNPGLPVIHHAVALGDRIETRRLMFGPPGNVGMTSLVERHTEDGVPVECTTVDTLVASGKIPAPTLIKIDVEGFEWQALQGAEKVLGSGCVKAIAFECEADREYRVVSDDLRLCFEQHGYTISHIPRPDGEYGGRENFLAHRASPTSMTTH